MEHLKVEMPELSRPSRENTHISVDFDQEVLQAVECNIMRLPKRFVGKSLKTFKNYTSKVDMAVHAINNNESVFITGLTGAGKTHLAIGLAYQWFAGRVVIKEVYDSYNTLRGFVTESLGIKKVYPDIPIFLPSVELFLELKASFDTSKTEDEILKPYCECDLLIIDDIGAEKVSDWSRQIFYTLIDRRYREMKQTIITSNLSLDDLAKSIDERISSRIVEMGVVIKLDGADFRLKK